MNKKVSDRLLATWPKDYDLRALSRCMRDIGHDIYRMNAADISAVRDRVYQLIMKEKNEHARGICYALNEVLAGRWSHVENEEKNDSNAQFIVSNNLVGILRTLDDSGRQPLSTIPEEFVGALLGGYIIEGWNSEDGNTYCRLTHYGCVILNRAGKFYPPLI